MIGYKLFRLMKDSSLAPLKASPLGPGGTSAANLEHHTYPLKDGCGAG